jgi:predicted O-linked N-acetylglucosamine transferase (SPINDLY family)
VADLGLDVLVYTDIGMDQFTYCFAFARLAPIQCLFLGHPDTSGIKTIDYCFTAQGMDIDTSQDYYSEQLVYFNEIPAVYGEVKPPENPISKKDLGYSETANLYVCPMKNQKIHPDFDLAVQGILQKDKNAEVYFFEDRGDRTDIVFDRLKKILTPEQFKRIKELPWMEPARFWNAIYQADVILDTFHFGAGTTAFQVIGIGTPLINLPADTAKGRCAYVMYTYIGVTDTIATDLNDYIAKAIKFANDKQLNQEFRAKVLANNPKLFNNFSVVPEMIDFFEDKVYGLQDN